MIKTSIIVPVYNTEPYLEACFESIFSQTQREIEVIAINDGSTDNSLHVLEEIKKRYPELIIFSQENKGLGDARNKGIELATGEYIYFIDSDDCLEKTAMETCYRYAAQYQLDVVLFDAETFGDEAFEKASYKRTEIIRDQKVVISGEEYACKYWLQAYFPTAWLIYTSAQFLKKNNLRFITGLYYEDNEFHCKMLPLAGRVMYIPYSLYRRRYRSCSITTVPYDIRHAQDHLEIIHAVDRQNHSEKLKSVIQRIKLNFLRTVLAESRKSEEVWNHQAFMKRFYETAREICTNNIDECSTYQNIKTLCEISDAMPESIVAEQEKKRMQSSQKETFQRLFRGIALQSENSHIGIYGTGRKTARFLAMYREQAGEIQAKLTFIDSTAGSGEKQYENSEVVNINDIGRLPLECILIIPARYEQEICGTIQKKYGDRFRVIRLWTDLGI